MTGKKRWVEKRLRDGVREVSLSSWKHFSTFVDQKMIDKSTHIWRGQAEVKWPLECTLDRILREAGKSTGALSRTRAQHLRDFKFAARGRRGTNPRELGDNEWWALAQHNGLATPLLDWTTSPYAAAYFAFHDERKSSKRNRAVYALDQEAVERKCGELTEKLRSGGAGARRGSKPTGVIEFVRPLSDDNPRLVSQSGLFTRAPDGMTMHDWVRRNFAGEKGLCVLMEITIPNTGRLDFLRSLNRMNVNHLTLFPDLYGASKYCNLKLGIPKY